METDKAGHLKLNKEIKQMKSNNVTLINLEYKYFIFDTEHNVIVGGNEYKDDAIDCMDEFNDECYCAVFKVYTAKHLIDRKDINPYNVSNWSNPQFN